MKTIIDNAIDKVLNKNLGTEGLKQILLQIKNDTSSWKEVRDAQVAVGTTGYPICWYEENEYYIILACQAYYECKALENNTSLALEDQQAWISHKEALIKLWSSQIK